MPTERLERSVASNDTRMSLATSPRRIWGGAKPDFGVHYTVENWLTILVLAYLEIWCVVSRLDEIALVVNLEQPRGFIAHLTAQNTRYRKACFTCVEWRAIHFADLTHRNPRKNPRPNH